MQEESGDQHISFKILEEDKQLIQLFTNSDQKQNTSFQLIPVASPYHKNRFDHLSIKEAEIQKGYASDESPEKKMKNKRIKKRKILIPSKIEAHKDRATTKFYIQSLQNRVQQLELQVERLKNLNKLNLDYIKKINDSELNINCFFQHRQKIIQKLQKLTNADKPDLRRISSELTSIKKKQGCYGSDRIKTIQYYFKQLVNAIVTNSHKYFAKAAAKNTDLFNPESIDTWQDWRKELFRKLDLSPQILAYISAKRGQIIALHHKFNAKLLQTYGNKCSLLQISRQMENLYQKMNEQLTPLQTGRLICFWEKYKFETNLYDQESLKKMYEQLSDHTIFSYEASSIVICKES